MKRLVWLVCLSWGLPVMAQSDSNVVHKFASAASRNAFRQRLISNTISRNLSLPLSASSSSNWEDAFTAISLLHYQQPWIDLSFQQAADSLKGCSPSFQQAFLDAVYAQQRWQYGPQVQSLITSTPNPRIAAMCGFYLQKAQPGKSTIALIQQQINRLQSVVTSTAEKALLQGWQQLQHPSPYQSDTVLTALLDKNYLPGNVLLLSLQRKNRDYPGLVLIRDTSGYLLMDSNHLPIAIPQLARSVSNMPGIISNGNTPQGLYRMYGISRSRSLYIGPTDNLQLSMPGEAKLAHFLKDSSITDSVWNLRNYQQLLPNNLQTLTALQESYFAGMAGRSEIIAHGTGIDPAYYQQQPYYPFTPTAGCLATKEFWNADGKRIYSDQLLLANAVRKAGGANGYLIVLEIDDQQKPVTLADLLPVLTTTVPPAANPQ